MARPPTRLSGAFTRAEIQKRYRIRQAANKQKRRATQTLAALAAGEVPVPAGPPARTFTQMRKGTINEPIAAPPPGNLRVTNKFRAPQIAPPPSALSSMIGAPIVLAPRIVPIAPAPAPAPAPKDAASITITPEPPSPIWRKMQKEQTENFPNVRKFSDATEAADTDDGTGTDHRLNEHEFKQFAGPHYNDIVAVLTQVASGKTTRNEIAAACQASPMAVLKIVGWLEHQNLVTVDATGRITTTANAIDTFRNRLNP